MARDHGVFRMGDGRVFEVRTPVRKPTPQWQKGFDAGLVAALVVLAGAGVSMMVRGATVRMIAGHHYDEVWKAARDRFRAPPPKKKDGDDE